LEEQLGDAAEWTIGQLYRVEDEPQAVNRLRNIARKLTPATQRSKISYSFHVLDTQIRNAFGLPNGRIFLTRGMLELVTDEDELAAVIAHELAHVNYRHALLAFQHQEQNLWRRIFVSGTVGLIPLAGNKLSYLLLDRGFDHANEFEADLAGIHYMRNAGIDPQAMVRFLEKVERDPQCRKHRSFLSTHPGERERIESIRRHLQTYGGTAVGKGGSQ
jgi:predicted Zn-dependent protease